MKTDEILNEQRKADKRAAKEIKRPVGRPKKDNAVKKELRTVYISKEVYEFYFKRGGGNFSKGVELVCKNNQLGLL